VQFPSFLAKSFLSRCQTAGFSFPAGVILVIMISGLTITKVPNSSRTTRPERYHRLALAAINRMPFAKYQHCSSLQSKDTLIPGSFILAVVAVENYGRPLLRRWLEELLAKISLALLGRIPDYSLGVGQLKLSTARLVVDQKATRKQDDTLADSELLQLVVNPCENLGIVHGYLDLLMHKFGFSSFDKSAAMIILRHYNGQQSLKQESQIYQEVVWEVFSLYRKNGSRS
jgi:hypothetical protein